MFALARKSSLFLGFYFYHFKESYLPCIGKPILVSSSNSDYHTLDISDAEFGLGLSSVTIKIHFDITRFSF